MTFPTKITEAPQWVMRPNDPALIQALSSHGENLAELVLAKGELVKRGGHRLVWRLRLPGLDIHAKRNQVSGLRGRARRILRGHKALLEANRLSDLTLGGVPTLELLGVALEPGYFGASWILTRTAMDKQPLDKLLTAAIAQKQAVDKFAITSGLAQLLSTMHGQGFHHTDLHPGNILYSPQSHPQMLLLDVHDLRRIKPTWRANLSNLVILNRWFQGRTPRHERFRFLLQYLGLLEKTKPECPWSARTMARLIEAKTNLSTQELWRGRDYRCFQSNKDFRSVSMLCGPVRAEGFAVNNTEFFDPSTILPSPFPEVNQERSQTKNAACNFSIKILKKSKSATVFLSLPAGEAHEGAGWIIKDIPPRPWPQRLLGNHPCRRSWMLGHALRGRFLPTPKPLAWLRFPDGGQRLVQSAIPNSILLDSWWKSVSDPAQRRELCLRLGTLIRKTHEMGVRHRDLKAANILIDATNSPWLIDLVGVKLKVHVSSADRQNDLARLLRSALSVKGVGNPEMVRFLRHYLGGRLSPDWKSISRNILQLAEKKIQRNQQRGRVNG